MEVYNKILKLLLREITVKRNMTNVINNYRNIL